MDIVRAAPARVAASRVTTDNRGDSFMATADIIILFLILVFAIGEITSVV